MALIRLTKVLAFILLVPLAMLNLGGCATGASSLECGIESMHPTVMAAIDSFESASIAIKLSNRVLLEMPINEQDSWPEKLYGAPSGTALLKMGLSLLGSSQGVTIPLEIDQQTGLPRPTSSLYIFLRDREKMLNREESKEDLRFFRTQPATVIAKAISPMRRKPGTQLIDEHVYRNPLMAFGVVTANRDEMVRVQQDIDLTAQGFKQCDAWVRQSREGELKPAACHDPALKQPVLEARIRKTYSTRAPDKTVEPEPALDRSPANTPSIGGPKDLGSYFNSGNRDESSDQNQPREKKKRTKPFKGKRGATDQPPEQASSKRGKPVPAMPDEPEPVQVTGVIYITEQDRQVGEKTEELETMRKNYGRLASRVYKASVAGADFTMSSIVKIGCAITHASKALPKIKDEFKGAKGYYNMAMVVSRVKIIINALGYYKNNLGLQFTAYRTMYQQLQGTYPELQDENPSERHNTMETMTRIELAMATLEELDPKFKQLADGNDVTFTDAETDKMEALARLFPSSQRLEKDVMLALKP